MISQEEESSNVLNQNSSLEWLVVRLNELSTEVNSGAQIDRLSPTALAYLGDAVYELYVRTCYLLPPKRSHSYHNQVVEQVRAETQAETLRDLKPHLTSDELEILRRGRNAATGRPRRVSPQVYQQATSLETLIGYLYLTNPQRLTQLLARIKEVALISDQRNS